MNYNIFLRIFVQLYRLLYINLNQQTLPLCTKPDAVPLQFRRLMHKRQCILRGAFWYLLHYDGKRTTKTRLMIVRVGHKNPSLTKFLLTGHEFEIQSCSYQDNNCITRHYFCVCTIKKQRERHKYPQIKREAESSSTPNENAFKSVAIPCI